MKDIETKKKLLKQARKETFTLSNDTFFKRFFNDGYMLILLLEALLNLKLSPNMIEI